MPRVPKEKERPKPPPPPPRRRRWLLGGLLGAAVLVAAAPTLLSLTPIPLSLLAGAIPSDAGRLGARSTSLSWTGPIAVSGLELRDAEGGLLLAAERVELVGGVLGLLAGESAPIELSVTSPRIDLVVGPAGTNFDSLLRALEAKNSRGGAGAGGKPAVDSTSRPLRVRISAAAARVTELATGARWLADGVELELFDPGRGIDAVELTAAGKVAAVDRDGGAIGAPGSFQLRLGEAAQGGRLARAEAKGLPLSVVEPFLRIADPEAAISGTVDLEGDAAWRPGDADAPATNRPADVLQALATGGVRSAGLLRLREVVFRGAATEGGPVQLATIEGPWRFAARGDGVAIEQLDLTSDVGRLSATGTVVPAELERWSAGVPALPRDLRAAARLDLDRLAAVAPQLLNLQNGARLESGRVDVSAACDAGRLEGRLATGPLRGVAGDRQVEWREPLDVRLTAQQDAPTAGLAGWRIESFLAASTFFGAQAQGDAARLAGDANLDLDRLAQELAPLVDLGETRLAGKGKATFTLERDEAARSWRLVSRGGLEGLFVGAGEAPLASEPRLDFSADLAGSLAALTDPPKGTLDLNAGDDRLRITLPGAAEGAARPFEARLSGDAARWLRRVGVAARDLPSPESIGLVGSVELAAAGALTADGGTVDRLDLALVGLGLDTAAVAGPRVRLTDERIAASGVAAWNSRSGEVKLDRGQLVSSVASASLREVLVSIPNPAVSRGELAYRVDLARLDRWMPPRDKPARYAATGLVEGTARVRGVPEGTQALVRATGKQLALGDRQAQAGAPAVVWSEPQLQLDADVMVIPLAAPAGRAASYSIEVRDARLQSRSISGSFGGRIADLAAMRGVELGGGIDYDLEKLTPILWPQLGDGVRLVGRDRATFRLETEDDAPANASPVARLRARVEAPWQSADLFGLPVGGGKLGVTLQRGVATVDPLDIAVGGGKLTAAATATLDPPPETLRLAPGPLVTDVAISQQVTERVLKFIAPVLADSARIAGRFSMALSEFAAPLTPPPSGPPPVRAAGVLDVHQVRVLPGPAVAEWVALARQIAGVARDGVEAVGQPSDAVLVAIDDSRVEFKLIDGRVYHRGLRFNVGDALVQSEGSVGMDESLDLVLSVPILDEWVERRPVILGRLRGQAVRIPVQGTLSRPKINRDAFKQLSGQLLESAAAGAIEGGLNLLLERLRQR